MTACSELRGFLAAKNLNIECLGAYDNLGNGVVQYNNLLHKFPKDEIYSYGDGQICFLNGYIYNKSDFADSASGRESDLTDRKSAWSRAFTESLKQDPTAHFQKLRGAFCGYTYDDATRETLVYTDHTSNKAVYYFVDGDRWIISKYLDFMVRVLRANGIAYHFNPTAAQYMLTYGYMLDDSTYIKEIHRLLPGCYGIIRDRNITLTQYYKLENREQKMTEEEAVEKLDRVYRQAVAREFDKDREYGYRHLVDLSAGLDSRMVSFVAHDMGYTDQTNITYSKLGYLDDTISAKMARYLGHEYLFKSLDDIRWMYDIDEMTLKNNGAAISLGMTGGNRMLKALNMEHYGIEHTGNIGDVVIGSYYHDKKTANHKPVYGLNTYSSKLHYDFNEKLLDNYETQESFALNTRGFLGMLSTYMIRDNYLESNAVFGDVDLLEEVLSIPFEYRRQHKIYLKWIEMKYPDATKFGWEKWGGIKPKKSHIFFRKVKTTQRLLSGYLCRLFRVPDQQSMNPMDYWYNKDEQIQAHLQEMYEARIGNKVLPQELADDMRMLYQTGNFIEKCLVLTVLSAAHLYFE